MPQTFFIASSLKVAGFFLIGDKSKIAESMFWDLVEKEVKILTSQHPDKYDETVQKVKDHLLKGRYKNSRGNLTINNICFEVKGCKDK